MAEAYCALLSSNFTIPLVKTPEYRLSDITAVKIVSQELKTLYCPYSAVDRSLVKIGVVITEMPLPKKEHIKNQNEALTCTGSELYLLKIFFNFSAPNR